MTTNKITKEDFIEGARSAVLAALDGYIQDLTGHEKACAWRDGDLTELFAGIDAHMGRVATRFNDPESREIGSADLSIIFD